MLLIGFILILYCSYEFAIAKTVKYYQQYKSNTKILENNSDSPNLLYQLKIQEKNLDHILASSSISPDDMFQNYLLKELHKNAVKYNLKIVDFTEPHVYTVSDNTLITYSFSIQGSFNGSLILLNKLENTSNFGNIKHIAFTKKVNYKTKVPFLITEVMLQKVKSE